MANLGLGERKWAIFYYVFDNSEANLTLPTALVKWYTQLCENNLRKYGNNSLCSQYNVQTLYLVFTPSTELDAQKPSFNLSC